MTFGVIVIDLNPNLFQVGGFLITWHGVFSVLGILAAVRIGQFVTARDGIESERIYDAAVWMVILGLIGARLLFVWENYQRFVGQWSKALLINEGGISQWGGLFGAIAGAFVWSRRAKISFGKIMDAIGPAALLGFAIGRIGDVINGEHHGTPTDLPWAVEYVNPKTLGEPGRAVHPEVAYELTANLVLLAILLPLHSRLKGRFPDGVTGLIYLGLYAATRFCLSFLRTDSLVFGLRQAQWASLAMVLAAVILIPWLLSRWRSSEPEPAGLASN